MSDSEEDELVRQAMLQIEEMERADKHAADKELRQRQEDERLQKEEEQQLQMAIRLSEESAKHEAAAATHRTAQAAGAAAAAARPSDARRASRPAAPAALFHAPAAAAAPAPPPTAPRRLTLPPSGASHPAPVTAAAAGAPRRSLPSSLELLGSGRGSPVSPLASMPAAPPARKRKNSEPASSPAAAAAASTSHRHSPAVAAAAAAPAFPVVPDPDAIDYSPLHELRLLFPGPSPFVDSFLREFCRTHSRAEAPLPSSAEAASAAAGAAAASSSSAAAAVAASPHPGFDGVGSNGVPYRNLEMRSDRDLVNFVHELRLLLRQSPQTVLPPEVVRALWGALQSESVSIGCVESLAADITGLLVLSPHSFLPSLSAWESWCHQALEFNTWLQAKDKAQKEGELERIKEEVMSSTAEAAALSPIGIPALFRLESELARQRKIASTLAYQEQQEIHYQKWFHVLRIWTDAFIMDITARQRGTAHVATEIMDPLQEYSPDLIAQLPPRQSHPHWPPPLLYSLVTRGAQILTYTVSEADAAALAAQTGPKLQTEEEQLAAVHSVLAAPIKRGAAGRGRGRGRGRGSRGGGAGSRGGRGGKAAAAAAAAAAASASFEVSHPPSVKRARTTPNSRPSSDRDSADNSDDGADAGADHEAAADDDADGDEEGDAAGDPTPPMASFLLWWLEIPRWIGMDPASSAASRADHAAQRTIAATFRSRQALQTFQYSVTRFLDVLRYVNGAQDQRLGNIRLRQEAQQRGKKYIDTEQGLVAF